MKELVTLIQPAFDWTWKNSVQVALLIGLVLVVQKVLGRWLTPRLRYALSLIILFRLLLPATLPNTLSLENLFTSVAWPTTREAASSVVAEPPGPIASTVAGPISGASPRARPAAPSFALAAPSRPPTLSLAEILGLAWACGLLALVSFAGWRYAQWCRLIRQGRRLSDTRLLALLDGARQAMGVRRPVTLVALARLSSPAVFGFRRVHLLLPEDALDHLTDQDLRLLLLHEMAHVRRQDMLLNLLLMAVQFVHWFNPLVWVGLHRLRADRELVCDAMVLQRTRPEQRSGYGSLLLKLLTDFPAAQPIIPTAVPMVSSKREIKRRIISIKYHRRASRTTCVATGLAVAALACLTFTGSSQQPPVVLGPAASEALTNSPAINGPSTPGLPTEQQPLETRFYKFSTNTLIQGLHVNLAPTATNLRALLDYFKQAGVDLDRDHNPRNSIIFDDHRGLLMVRATLHDLDIVGQQLAALRLTAGSESVPGTVPKSLSRPVVTNSLASNALPELAKQPLAIAFGSTIDGAVIDGDLQKVKTLLKDNPDLVFGKSAHGLTPLHEAAALDHKDVVVLLLASKAEVNAKDNIGLTPLHDASWKGHKDVAEVLLASNAEANAKDNNGRTPLHWAADMGQKDVVELLLANRAEVNAKDNRGWTPLHHASCKGHKDVVQLLLANKAEANAKAPLNSKDTLNAKASTSSDWTPLHLASAKGHLDVVELLLTRGADVNGKNSLGATPLHLAQNNAHKDVAEFLRQHGGHE